MRRFLLCSKMNLSSNSSATLETRNKIFSVMSCMTIYSSNKHKLLRDTTGLKKDPVLEKNVDLTANSHPATNANQIKLSFVFTYTIINSMTSATYQSTAELTSFTVTFFFFFLFPFSPNKNKGESGIDSQMLTNQRQPLCVFLKGLS